MIDSIIEMIKLISLMVFVSSIGAQCWIAFLDITKFFSDKLEKFRPTQSQDKYSRIAIIIGMLILLS
jgi:hypothetical protein